MTPPFHKLHRKKLGDRVKIPRHAADESRGYYYGIVINGCQTFDGFDIAAKGLIIKWDEDVPFLGKYSNLFTAIKDISKRNTSVSKQSLQIANAQCASC